MSDPKFIHLRVHSDFSMVDGLNKVPPIVKKVAELGMPAMALTDFTNLCGLVKFYGTAHGSGVKPIIGADFKMQSDEFGEELTQVRSNAALNVKRVVHLEHKNWSDESCRSPYTILELQEIKTTWHPIGI